MEDLVLSKKFNAIFTGHTHKARNENVNGVLVLNPGTTSFWAGGLLREGSVAIYDSRSNTAEIFKVPYPLW